MFIYLRKARMKMNFPAHTTLRSLYNLLIIPTSSLLYSALLFSTFCITILIPSTTQAMRRSTIGSARYLASGTFAKNIQTPAIRTLGTTLPTLPKPNTLSNAGNQAKLNTIIPIRSYCHSPLSNKRTHQEKINDIELTVLNLLKEHAAHSAKLFYENNRHTRDLLIMTKAAECTDINDAFKKNVIFGLLAKRGSDEIYCYQNIFGICDKGMPMFKNHLLISRLIELARTREKLLILFPDDSHLEHRYDAATI